MIVGHVDHEEIGWWNPNEREKCNRPGPGILSPVLAEELHNPNHSLFSINVVSTPSTSDHLMVSSPTEREVRKAVPHPDAYYCPEDNGWVILCWGSSPLLQVARSFINSPNALSDQARRRLTGSCIEEDQPSGKKRNKKNKIHHFHKYEKAVDSHKLTPPFRQEEWQIFESLKLKRRAVVEKNSGDDEGKLLDLYVCCQCSFYCVASGVIPGVIPRKYIDKFIRDKRRNPSFGKTGDQAVASALETFTVAIENKLWRGDNRMIKVFSSSFQTKVGWTRTIKYIFDILGFVEETKDRECVLQPPITDNTHQGKQNRRKLLRAWVEIHAWLADFKRLHASHFKDTKDKGPRVVRLDSAREMYETAIGAHPDQIPRGRLSNSMLDALQPLEACWKGLGLTPTTYSADLLAFAYLAQCRCDPAGTPRYFTYLSNILKNLQKYGSCPVSRSLQELIAIETSQGRFTLEDVATAARTLGFGLDNVLGVDYDDEIPDNMVENVWRDSVKRSWRDLQHGSEVQRLTNDAFRILAESRGSIRLRKTWEAGKKMAHTNQQQFQATQLQFATITSSLDTLTQTMSNLEHRIVNTKRAFFALSKESLSRNLSDINTEIIKLQTKLLFETDPHQSELIGGILKNAQDQQKHLEGAINNCSREFLTIVGRPIVLPQHAPTIITPQVEALPYRQQTPSKWSWSTNGTLKQHQKTSC